MNEIDILLRGLAALVAGGIVGLERSYRGRAAGLRTNALVALGAALAVAMATHAGGWAPPGGGDPTRVVQGIITGIGFLGAGVIVREGFSVRGLTTAAAIWVVACIGVLFGAGLYVSGACATLAAWISLETLRRLESRLPMLAEVHAEVALRRDAALAHERIRAVAQASGFRVTEVSYRLDDQRNAVAYELVMSSRDAHASERFAAAMLDDSSVLAFRIVPTRD